MLTRAFDHQIKVGPSTSGEKAREQLQGHLEKWLEQSDASLAYQPIPIRTLVQAQYAEVLAVLGTVS